MSLFKRVIAGLKRAFRSDWPRTVEVEVGGRKFGTLSLTKAAAKALYRGEKAAAKIITGGF